MAALRTTHAHPDLAGFVASLSHRVEQRLEAVRCTVATRRAEEDRRKAEYEIAEEKKASHRAARLAIRRPLAMKGLKRLIELGQSDVMKELLTLLHRGYGGNPSFSFYDATRASGDAWLTGGAVGSGTRDVLIALRPAGIFVEYGCRTIFPQELVFLNEDSDETLADKLRAIEWWFPNQPLIALRPDQYYYEWDPGCVAYQVMVGCARKNYFEHLLEIALEKYRK